MLKASFLGLGNMGFQIAQNLLKGGVQLAVYNRTQDKAQDLINQGATLLKSPQEAFEFAPLVFSMVSNDFALNEVSEELLKWSKKGAIHASMSTVSVGLARKLYEKHLERGVHYVSMPVFGRPEAAQSKSIWVCLGGNDKAKKEILPYLPLISMKSYDFGEEPERANAVKLTGNFMILSIIEMLSEAFAFAEKNGIALDQLYSFLTESFFPSPVFKTYGKLIINQNFFPPGMKMSLGLKDIKMFTDRAEEVRMATPLANLLEERVKTGMENNLSEMDWAAISLLSKETVSKK